MMNRNNFMRRVIGSIIAMVAASKNPLKATEPMSLGSQELTNPLIPDEPSEAELLAEAVACEDELEYDRDDLWPNDKPMPCDTLPEELKHPKINCRFCRYKHNMMILESDPEWFDNIQVDLDGKWSEVGFL